MDEAEPTQVASLLRPTGPKTYIIPWYEAKDSLDNAKDSPKRAKDSFNKAKETYPPS
jgi:hypothetical protein